MAKFQPAPTHAPPVIVDEVTGKSTFNPIWLKWFLDVAQFLSGTDSSSGGSTGTGDFVRQSGPTINSPALVTPNIGVAGGTSLTLTGGLGANNISSVTITMTGLTTLQGGATLLKTTAALTNGAAAAAGTLLNAPVAGNPTKWIAIDDAGTVRQIPAW
jgi:hypothetical protein